MPKVKPLTEVENIPVFIQQVNSNFEKVEEALENTISRDGSTPNEMNAALDMNGQDIINIGGVSFVDSPYRPITQQDYDDMMQAKADAEDAAASAALYGPLTFPSASAFFASSAPDASMIGKRAGTQDGLAWDIVAAGTGDLDHPVTGVGVRVVPSAGYYPFDAFGAKGDGVSDDYAVFKLVASLAENRKGFGLRFGAGKTYFIGKILGIDAGADHIRWTNIEFLDIDLNGSTVRSNGDYHRDVITKRQVMPFLVSDCKYVRIANGDIDGSNYETTRAAVAETLCHGIRAASEMVLLENLDVHHWISDGIYCGGTGNANTAYYSPRGIFLNNVRSRNNARQALSVTMGAMLYAVNCEFLHSGFTGEAGGETEGGYERHQPAAGVDIEPDVYNTRSIDNGFIGFYRFENCRFAGNYNYQFLCAHPSRQESVRLKNCIVDGRRADGGYHNSQYQFWPISRDTIVEGCTIYGNVSGVSVSNTSPRDGLMKFRDCTFYAEDHLTVANNRAFGAASNYIDIDVQDCRFIWRSKLVAGSSGTHGFPYFEQTTSNRCKFRNNEIIVPEWAHPYAAGVSATKAWALSKFTNITNQGGNTFEVRDVVDGIWSAGQRVMQGAWLRNGSNVYEAQQTGQMGTTAPTHTSGTESDGLIEWKWLPRFTEDEAFYTLYSSPVSIEGDIYPDKTKFRVGSSGAFNSPHYAGNARKRGTTAQRPASPSDGQTYFDTTVSALIVATNAGTWVKASDGSSV